MSRHLGKINLSTLSNFRVNFNKTFFAIRSKRSSTSLIICRILSSINRFIHDCAALLRRCCLVAGRATWHHVPTCRWIFIYSVDWACPSHCVVPLWGCSMDVISSNDALLTRVDSRKLQYHCWQLSGLCLAQIYVTPSAPLQSVCLFCVGGSHNPTAICHLLNVFFTLWGRVSDCNYCMT